MSYSLLYSQPVSQSSNSTTAEIRSSSTFDRYLEAEVMNADPVKLTGMLFRGSIEAVQAARRALAAGDILLRSKQIVKSWDIVRELDASLNTEAGGELGKQLKELYAYVGQRLMEANSEQSDAKLNEAESVLTLLGEAWRGVPAIAVAQPPTADYAESEYRPISHAC